MNLMGAQNDTGLGLLNVTLQGIAHGSICPSSALQGRISEKCGTKKIKRYEIIFNFKKYKINAQRLTHIKNRPSNFQQILKQHLFHRICSIFVLR